SCVSSERGARVVARGGTLTREIVLCVTERPATDGRAEFYGTGTIPAEVFTALPQIGCDASGALEVSAQRYTTAHGAASLFRCRRPATQGAAVPVADAIGDASAATTN
ncbi:MAG: hypothetical protein WCJ30_28635, partial [Deltaproteobacteria bacterium]